MSKVVRLQKGSYMRLISAETMRALMNQNRFSYARLARYAGCHKSMISHLLSGRSKTVTPELGHSIAEALGVPDSVLWQECKSPTTGTTDNQKRALRRRARQQQRNLTEEDAA